MIDKILVPVGLNKITDSVIKKTISIAQLSKAQIYLLYIEKYEPEIAGYVTGAKSSSKSIKKKIIKKSDKEKTLEKIQKKLSSRGLKIKTISTQGYLVEEIIKHTKKLKINLVIMGTHGHGLIHDLLFGSVSHMVIKKTRCSVLLVPHNSN